MASPTNAAPPSAASSPCAAIGAGGNSVHKVRYTVVFNMSKSKTLLCTIALAASGLLAQVPAPPPLIHLYAVALDASGQPVTDLTAGDFKIVDQTRPQTIFSFHKPATGPAAPLAPLEFS